MTMMSCTITLFRDEDKLLLGLKREGRPFGGNWNGPGGKIEDGETVLEALVREAEDECGLIPVQYEKKGIVYFRYRDQPLVVQCHIFEVTKYAGALKESSEEFSQFKWYGRGDIPYRQMLPADTIWLPQLLAGEKIATEFLYDHRDTMRLLEWNM